LNAIELIVHAISSRYTCKNAIFLTVFASIPANCWPHIRVVIVFLGFGNWSKEEYY
jgi:hypothetical protein